MAFLMPLEIVNENEVATVAVCGPFRRVFIPQDEMLSFKIGEEFVDVEFTEVVRKYFALDAPRSVLEASFAISK